MKIWTKDRLAVDPWFLQFFKVFWRMYYRVFVLSLLAIWNLRIYQISPNFSLIIYEMRNRDISSSGQTKTWVGAEINSVPVQGKMKSFRKFFIF